MRVLLSIPYIHKCVNAMYVCPRRLCVVCNGNVNMGSSLLRVCSHSLTELSNSLSQYNGDLSYRHIDIPTKTKKRKPEKENGNINTK